MDVLHVEGPVQLKGTISVNGSKNASLPIMASAILAPGASVFKSVPNLSDIRVCAELLTALGCKVSRESDGPAGDRLDDDR